MKKLKLIKMKNRFKSKEKIFNCFKIATDEDTIKKMADGMSICRFGDGEFNLIFGKGIGFQPYSDLLSSRLKEILINQEANNNILISIPKIFRRDFSNYNDFAFEFWKRYYRKNVIRISKIINKDMFYYSSQVTRFYMDAKDKSACDKNIENLKRIWKNKDLLIVEGCQTRMGVGNDLLKEAKSIKRILCPAENAFEKYQEILNSCLKQTKNCLVLIALGPTATVLAYDLSHQGYQALDIGHIDIEYEWYIKRAKEKIKIENKYINETGGYSGSLQIEDIDYKNSIIYNIE